LPEGVKARTHAATTGREHLKNLLGPKAENFSDAELVDSIWYSVFPNFTPWGGPGTRQQYRWRPWGNDPEMSVMDIIVLAPFKGERPPPAPLKMLGPDQSWREATELGSISLVEDQDAFNLEAVQKGLHMTTKSSIVLSNILFAGGHSHISFGFALSVFVPGIFWGWLFAKQNSLIGVSVSHVLIGVWGAFIVGIENMF
jgi:hypothetical protein